MPAKKQEVSQENNTFLDIAARNISFLMSKRGVDAAAICRGTGLAIATLNTLRRGEGNPTISTLISIAQFFGVTLTELTEILLSDDIFKNKCTRSIPLIKLGQIDEFLEHRLSTGETYTVDVDDPNKNFFAISINNDALLPQFNNGSICIISENSNAADGDIVLIKIKNNQPCFRKIFIEDEHNLFMPISISRDASPSIYHDYKIIGIVNRIIDVRIISER
jgi:transcriptional regulator with XRE-family HTH domain